MIARLQAIENNQREHSFVPDLLTALDNAINTARQQLDKAFRGSDGDSRHVHAHISHDLDQIQAAFAPFHPGASHLDYDHMYPIAKRWIADLRNYIQE